MFQINTLLAKDNERLQNEPTDLSIKSSELPNETMPTNIPNFEMIQQYLFWLSIFNQVTNQVTPPLNLVKNELTTTDIIKPIQSPTNIPTPSLQFGDKILLNNSKPSSISSNHINDHFHYFDGIPIDHFFHVIDQMPNSEESIEEIVKSIKYQRNNFANFIKDLYERHSDKFELTNGGDGIVNPFRKQLKVEREKLMEKFCIETELNYRCIICKKIFPSKKHMQRHIRSHGVNFDWLCKYCFKPFIDSYDLKRHTRVHTGVQPYKCLHCDRKFSQRCSLESHEVKIHSVQLTYAYKERRNKLFPCEMCSFSTPDKNIWLDHIISEHPNSLYAQEEMMRQLTTTTTTTTTITNNNNNNNNCSFF